jgi:hypothetical protein
LINYNSYLIFFKISAVLIDWESRRLNWQILTLLWIFFMFCCDFP